MIRTAALLLAIAVAGVSAAGSLGSSPRPSTASDKRPAKCLKWKKTSKGKRVCIKRAKPKPKPKPKPAPGTTTTTTTTAPPAGPPSGHYSANTSQNTTLQFDIAGSSLTNLAISELDTTCMPGSWLDADRLSFTGATAALGTGGAFHLAIPATLGDGGSATLTIDGTVSDSGVASGTFTWTHSYTAAGTALACASGTVTWTGGTGASAPAAPAGPQLGHYSGITSQNAHIQFDLGTTSGGYLVATNVALDEMDESCTPSANLSATGFYFGPFPFLVNASGHMHAAFSDSSETFVLDAAIDSTGHATGSAHDSAVVPANGTNYACDSGPVTWTAAKA